MRAPGPVGPIAKQPLEVVTQLVDGLVERFEALIGTREHHGSFHRGQDVPGERGRLDVGG